MEVKEKPKSEEPPAQKSPIEMFFKLGDWVTRGDPKRKSDFDFIMMWILFLAFFFVFLGNIYHFFTSGYKVAYLGWALFGLAIMWFQYFNLVNMRKMRAYQKQLGETTVEEQNKIEGVDEMLKSFKEDK